MHKGLIVIATRAIHTSDLLGYSKRPEYAELEGNLCKRSTCCRGKVRSVESSDDWIDQRNLIRWIALKKLTWHDLAGEEVSEQF